MTLSQIRNKIFRELNEAKIGQERIQPTDLLDVINEVYVEIAAQTKCFVRQATITSTSGTATYTMPADMFEIRCVRYHTGTTPLVKETVNGLSMISPSWRDTTAGTPQYFYLHSTSLFGLYPKPNTSSQNILVEGYIIPNDTSISGGIAYLAADADIPQFPVNYHKMLVYGSVYNLCTGLLATQAGSDVKAAISKSSYDALMAEFINYYSTGVNLKPIGA